MKDIRTDEFVLFACNDAPSHARGVETARDFESLPATSMRWRTTTLFIAERYRREVPGARRSWPASMVEAREALRTEFIERFHDIQRNS